MRVGPQCMCSSGQSRTSKVIGGRLNLGVLRISKERDVRQTFDRCLLCTLVLVVGCNSGSKRVQPVSIDSSSASSQAIELYDKDGDGRSRGPN